VLQFYQKQEEVAPVKTHNAHRKEPLMQIRVSLDIPTTAENNRACSKVKPFIRGLKTQVFSPPATLHTT